jgi:hypothetical protein
VTLLGKYPSEYFGLSHQQEVVKKMRMKLDKNATLFTRLILG